MFRLDLSYFYRLSNIFAEAKAISGEPEIYEIYSQIYALKSAIQQILGDVNIGGALRGCYPASQPLINQIDQILSRDISEKMQRYEVIGLQTNINSLEIVLVNELGVTNTYFVVDKKPYSTITLVSEGEALFPIDFPRKVPEAVKDMREAGRCLAFELPDATAFHILRATEAVVRKYWEHCSGNKPMTCHE